MPYEFIVWSPQGITGQGRKNKKGREENFIVCIEHNTEQD
jgi:hypothetical protein